MDNISIYKILNKIYYKLILQNFTIGYYDFKIVYNCDDFIKLIDRLETSNYKITEIPGWTVFRSLNKITVFKKYLNKI